MHFLTKLSGLLMNNLSMLLQHQQCSKDMDLSLMFILLGYIVIALGKLSIEINY